MHQFRAGSEIAFQHFMKRHLRALTFHAYRICRNQQVAEEIVADAFSKLWQRRSHFETESNIKSFLYISAKNAGLDYVRSAYNRNRSQLVELDEALQLGEQDPLTRMIHSELVRALVEEIDKLPARQSQVFRMAYLEGYSTAEICDALGITANAVFLAKKKAMANIRMVFSEKEIFTALMAAQLLLPGILTF